MISFCIGNGESRKDYNLEQLRDTGKFYGSNAIYRDIPVDYLCCSDKRMVEEALDGGYKGIIYTRLDWSSLFKTPQVKSFLMFSWDFWTENVKWKKTLHWGSGLHSAYLALRNNCDVLIMIGHDFWGVKNKHNNLYKNTHNYESNNHHAIDPSFWIMQFELLFTEFPETQFVFCQPNIKDWKIPAGWQDFSNVQFQELEELALLVLASRRGKILELRE